MIVHLEYAGGEATARLAEPDVFDALKIRVSGAPGKDERQRLLESLGAVDSDGEHVYLEREELIRLAGAEVADQDWRARLEAMVAYAAAKGWVDGGGRVRAHVESD